MSTEAKPRWSASTSQADGAVCRPTMLEMSEDSSIEGSNSPESTAYKSPDNRGADEVIIDPPVPAKAITLPTQMAVYNVRKPIFSKVNIQGRTYNFLERPTGYQQGITGNKYLRYGQKNGTKSNV